MSEQVSGDNEAQIEFWNGEAGATWVEDQERLDATLHPLSAEALRQAAAQPGERVLDVGCGCGTTSLALQASGAAVWGVDVSEPMLAQAQKRAHGLDNISFSLGDAATQTYSADHQLVFSRFGVMFFADPVAAFRQLRTALSEDGRLFFMCWQAPARNPWISVVGRAVQPFLDPDAPTPDPRAPGPFAFADEDYLLDILQQAGYRNIQINSFTSDVPIAPTLDEAVESQSRVGPLARVLAELDPATRDKAMAAAREALAAHVTPQGISLEAAVWMVSARR
ncbi:MAG: class I SAM-dependent methyltransferase [Pseudomonadota bacterium]